MKTPLFAQLKDQYQYQSGHSSKWDRIFWIVVLILTIKVLWGYWDRDITSGDTSSYFIEACRWYKEKAVNIVWSPLYTAYFGSWLSVSNNAVVAVFLHRLGLIVISTTLVAWIALRTLPRIFALLLTCWWVALPIHYNTLYEVHLFGAIPLFILVFTSILLREKWRLPILIGISLIATTLIRNEFILAVVFFLIYSVIKVLRAWNKLTPKELRNGIIRNVAMLFVVAVTVTFFYSASYVQGKGIKEASEPKHTLNMCQVYAFGYQQRVSWKGSPWTDCSSLMQEKFGTPLPSLQQMIVSNPMEVLRHFWWNMSLTQAGLEVLLFNATSSVINPDYVPVKIIPIVPTALLALSVLIIIFGMILIYRNKPVEYGRIRDTLSKAAPVLLAVLAISIAVILTQRPRPSYLLGAGMLYMWLVMLSLAAFSQKIKCIRGDFVFFIIAAVLMILVPSYNHLDLPSKQSQIKLLYNELLPNQASLCRKEIKLAMGQYQYEIMTYLCSPLGYQWNRRWDINTSKQSEPVQVFSIAELDPSVFINSKSFVNKLDIEGVKAAVINQDLLLKHPTLQSCSSIRDAFLDNGWQQLSYLVKDDGICIASYAKRVN